MKVLESYYPAPQEIDYEAQGREYEYDLRLEVGVEAGVAEVALHHVFVKFLEAGIKIRYFNPSVDDEKGGFVTGQMC